PSMVSTDPLLDYIAQRVDQYVQQYQLSKGKAFMLWYGVEALRLSEDEALEAVLYDGGNDKGIDLFHIDEESERIVIGQGKYRSNGRYKGVPGELYELVHTSDWLSNPESLER